ncbi:hypothetical protein PR048_006723 [Dryococelus australis]|uniref:Uncharacterized protein n=1 Tax=Dryococelus australis TaxID=614101 RepID=A0ABQ9IDY9_9NEOP|nr:hypothetical protein PR048_006723 [Dryococelus australis]
MTAAAHYSWVSQKDGSGGNPGEGRDEVGPPPQHRAAAHNNTENLLISTLAGITPFNSPPRQPLSPEPEAKMAVDIYTQNTDKSSGVFKSTVICLQKSHFHPIDTAFL